MTRPGRSRPTPRTGAVLAVCALLAAGAVPARASGEPATPAVHRGDTAKPYRVDPFAAAAPGAPAHPRAAEAGFASPEHDRDWIELSGAAFGTSWRVRLEPAPGAPPAQVLAREVQGVLDRIDARLSTWRDDSELARVNARRDSGWMRVSPETAAAVGKALEVYERSHGAFDPTVGPLVSLWGFGPAGVVRRPPARAAIEATLERVGAHQLALRHDPPALRKALPELTLDLSGVAKGLAADRVARHLGRRGIERLLVEIGGELCARGAGPGGGAWPVGIERPGTEPPQPGWVVGLSDAALATSGRYRRFFEHAGQRYAHVIDPRSGRPAAHDLVSVSVLARDAARADAFATALLVLGPDAGWSVAEREGLAVLFLLERAGGLEARANARFERHRLPAGRFRDRSLEAPARSGGREAAPGSSLLTLFIFSFAGLAAAGALLGLGLPLRRPALRTGCGASGSAACRACTGPCRHPIRSDPADPGARRRDPEETP